MAARENEIGKARCPLCGGVASLRVSSSGLSYLAMDCCKAQLFTRGDHSDTLARSLHIKEPAAPATQKQEPEPAKEAPPAAVKAPAVAATQTPAPAPASRPTWGLF